MLFDILTEQKGHKLLTNQDSIKRYFGEKSLEEIQKWQNE